MKKRVLREILKSREEKPKKEEKTTTKKSEK